MLLKKNDLSFADDPDIQMINNLDGPTAIRLCLEFVDEQEELDLETEFTLTFYFIEQFNLECIHSSDAIRNIKLSNSVKQKNFAIEAWRSCINHANSSPNYMIAFLGATFEVLEACFQIAQESEGEDFFKKAIHFPKKVLAVPGLRTDSSALYALFYATM